MNWDSEQEMPEEAPVEIDHEARRAEVMGEFRTFVRRHATILNDIVDERIRQDLKWGLITDAQSLDRRLTILTEEVGEVAEALNDHDELAHVREELIQVAACAVATVEAMDRGVWS